MFYKIVHSFADIKFNNKKNEIEKLESNCRPTVRYETQRNNWRDKIPAAPRSPLPGSPVSGNTAGFCGPTCACVCVPAAQVARFQVAPSDAPPWWWWRKEKRKMRKWGFTTSALPTVRLVIIFPFFFFFYISTFSPAAVREIGFSSSSSPTKIFFFFNF